MIKKRRPTMTNEIQKYPKEGRNGQKYYVRYPVRRKNGKYIAAEVLENGYLDLPIYTEFETEQSAKKACEVHNRYHGWSKAEVDKIICMSMLASSKEEKEVDNA